MADRYCQHFKVSQTAECLVAGHVLGLPCAAEHQAARVTAVNVTAQAEQSFCLSPAAVLALAETGGRRDSSQVTAGKEEVSPQDKRKQREKENTEGNGS